MVLRFSTDLDHTQLVVIFHLTLFHSIILLPWLYIFPFLEQFLPLALMDTTPSCFSSSFTDTASHFPPLEPPSLPEF